MVLTGRAWLVALLCVLPIGLSPWPATAFTLLALLLLMAIVVDFALAANTRRLHFSRLGDGAARLGEQVGAAEKALRKRMPSSASRCRFGVSQACPYGWRYRPVSCEWR